MEEKEVFPDPETAVYPLVLEIPTIQGGMMWLRRDTREEYEEFLILLSQAHVTNEAAEKQRSVTQYRKRLLSPKNI